MKILYQRKQMIAFFMPGFILGILYINFFARQSLSGSGMFGLHILEQYRSAAFDAKEYFLYVLKIRALPFLLVTGISFTSFRKISAYVVLVWTGFTSGMLLSMAAMEMGIPGCFFCLAGVLPQMIFYVQAYVVVLWYSLMYPQNKWTGQKTGFVAGMMVAGIMLEAFVNPILVKLFLNLRFIMI